MLLRVGGAIGTALLAVALEGQIKAALPHAVGLSGGAVKPIAEAIRVRVDVPLAHAFATTFWWAVVLTAVGLLPAIVLAVKVRGGPATAATRAGAPQAA